MDPANVGGLIGKGLFGFFLALVLIGVVCRIVLMKKTNDRYLKMIGKKFATFCLTTGLLGVVLYFFSYEEIRLFGARIWYPLWVIGFIAWGVVLVRFTTKDVPALREKNMKQSAKTKYIPGRK